MAITYKSQGAGVSTETSAAALSPLCPAIVDAGDILLAHVFWEGTATAPSTPANWSLLRGPDVIETTIAQHWVFGKIADGTEDAGAVAFGAPAVTTQRAARVYSFAGRTDGLITDLVNGFAVTSHATDPQMPTVTTTQAGGLAVALVAQNDNNAFAAPTGETGGDWVEAVAEYTAALTPGFSLGIETATPTSNPGTISGGTMATTNDPCGVIGFQIIASVPQVLTPATASFTTSTYAPTITITTNQVVTPGIFALALATFAPLIVVNTILTALATALTLATFAPVVTVASDLTVTPLTQSLALTTYAPGVGITNHQSVTLLSAALTLTTLAPTVQATANQYVTPFTRTAVIATFAPTITATNHQVVTTGFVTMTLTAYSPIVSGFMSASPTSRGKVQVNTHIYGSSWHRSYG